MKVFQELGRTIGGTPLVRLNRMSEETGCQIAAKLDFFNPLSSVKDRIAVAMLDDAESRGLIGPGSVVVEPTSGNTGIALAFVCAARGYSLSVVMPETMSVERRRLMAHLGARIVLTTGSEGMQGAVDEARRILENEPGAFMPDQFENRANPRIHRETTAEEIWRDTGGDIDCFVAGIGTGGTITGVGQVLKARKPSVRIVGIEPAGSAVLSGGSKGPHKIQGIGAGFVPPLLDRSLLDEICTVSDDEALETARDLALSEGIPCGISSGAAAAAACRIAKEEGPKGRKIVTLLASAAERYMSTELFRDPS
jgi:cysteine synthase A